ncbi:DNA endonuclease SmrA [Microbulbifer sp. OS29]|uniref:DNA endonuclease SmrA n=1 Tax=Microbulbifer okhotskensis TaxID=2926617 RepID=A0A9X2ESN5_9GAMM|nr:DNA endonuclease SmrA [Microbulbifer okhotskensis]MCO1335018.1 DNA endonuclease SmrA [Microbulbifer okhotskensis]
MSSDSKLFKDALGEMGDVKPLAQERCVTLRKEPKQSELILRERRAAATHKTERELNPLSGEYIDLVAPWDPLEFKCDGVQNGVYRNFRLGKYSVDARLDLHRHSVEMARSAVMEFVRDCVQADVRCALITHGKGEGRKQPALLKSCIKHWLPQLDDVLAFHSAQPQHGGLGATYLLLKKSQRKRQEIWEKHQRRG